MVVVLVDDLGYSDVGCFGSEIPTPEIDALASAGVRMRNFHTAPICSPTRASLLTGRAPHRAGFGRVASFDPGFPGYSMEFPDSLPTLASELRDVGYATFAIGKWHLTREIEQSAAGSRHGWPLQCGFDRFYGFLDGFTNFFHPHQLVADNHHLAIDDYGDDYYLTDDLTDRATTMIKELRSADRDRPFFLYFAHGAVHAPLQARSEDIEPFRGQYEAGWDATRAQRFERQKQLGLLAEDTQLPGGDIDAEHGFPPWEDLSRDEKRLAARYMEVYAAMVASVDRSLGSIRRTLEDLGEWDDTIVVFLSDNGASSDVGPRGTTRYMLGHGAPIPDDIERDVANIDLIGGPRVFAHYPSGWALTGNTPFRLYKRFTHAGGHTVPFVMHWPHGGLPSGSISGAYAHVSDLLPTILELAGVDGQPTGIDGISFADSVIGSQSETIRQEQIFESHGNRGLYSDGWEIVSTFRPLESYTDEDWELYDLTADPTEIADLAQAHPDRVRDLSRRWHELAAAGEVFPLEDGSGVFFHQRPEDHRPSSPVALYPGIPTIERIRARDLIWNRSFTVEAYLGEATGHRGVIVSHGDQASGYSLHVDDGVLEFVVNSAGDLVRIPAGGVADRNVIAVRVSCPAVGRWDLEVLVDGQTRATHQGVAMHTGLMTPLHGIDIGLCRGSPVCWDIYESHRAFPWTGGIDKVVYKPGEFAPDAPQVRVEEFRRLGLSIPGSHRPAGWHEV